MDDNVEHLLARRTGVARSKLDLAMTIVGDLGKTFVVQTSRKDDKLRGGESTRGDKDTYEDLVSVLRNLGYPGKRARQRIERSIETLESEAEPVTEEKILTRASAATRGRAG